MRTLSLILVLGACAGLAPSQDRIIDQRGGETIYLTNGVCVATVSAADDEVNVLLPRYYCGLEE